MEFSPKVKTQKSEPKTTMVANKESLIILPTFIIKLCRKFNLFPNERTTILSQSDDLQVLQYCLAYHNQKAGGDFAADSKEVLEFFEIMRQSAIKHIEREIENCYTNINSEASPEGGLVVASTASIQTASNETGEGVSVDEDDSTGLIQESKQDKVICLYQEYKKSSNHWSFLDAFLQFVLVLSDCNSDIHMSVKDNAMVEKLKVDVTDYISLQSKIIELLKAIKGPSSRLQDIDVLPNTPIRPQVIRHQSGDDISPVLTTTPRTIYSPSQRKELQRLLVQDIFRSYLHLLVNSRSQLAFARVFNIPERELDHSAFTHLKHEAINTGLSMYQTLSSYMRRIHLGGSGYAPSVNSPLMKYVKGLGMLLDLTQKLQTVIEEDLDLMSACQRIVNIIKVNLVRCKSGKFQRILVEPEAEIILNKLLNVLQEHEHCKGKSPERSVSSGGSVLGRKCVQVIQTFLDQSAMVSSELDHHFMSDIQISSQSPSRIPCLLTQFRSPAFVDMGEEKEEDKDEVDSFKKSTYPHKKQFVSSALYLDREETSDVLFITQNTLSTVDVIPSKTIVDCREETTCLDKTASKVSHNSNALPLLGKATKPKGGKRCLVAVTGQENIVSAPAGEEEVKCKRQNTILDSSPKSSRVASSQPKKGNNSKSSCRRRLMPQVKGQAKITGFLRL